MTRLHLEVAAQPLAIVRLDPGAGLPAWLDWTARPIVSVSRTAAEMSIIFPEMLIPADIPGERGWQAISVRGPLDFALTGILLSLLAPLSKAGIGVFALSTFETDHVLVRAGDLASAIAVLRPHHDIAVEANTGPAYLYRRAAPEDAPMVRDLTRAAYAKWVPVVGTEPRPMTADYDHAVRTHVIDLVFRDGEPIALIEMIPAEDHLMIQNIAILPAHQGQGLGRSLLSHAEQTAVALGVKELRLYTNQRMITNIVLYERTGYRRTGEEHGAFGTAVHMSKRL